MLGNNLTLEQRQILSAGQIQSLEILACTNQELNSFMTNEYLENPMLECSSDRQSESLCDLEQMYEKGASYRDQYLQCEEDDRRADIRAEETGERRGFVLGQLHRKNYSTEEWQLFGHLIECLDGKGFFTYEISDIAKLFGYKEETVRKCLDILKQLEPVGIFSRDVSECLVRQLKAQGITDEKLFSMVEEHMPDILKGHISTVTRALHISTAKVKHYIHMIGSLNPRPFMNVQEKRTEYIVPDILLDREGGKWKARINDNWMGEYKYNDYYIHMMQTSGDDELKEYFQTKLNRARFIMDCVEQRRHTIERVAEAIAELQEPWLLGRGALRPMTLENVAKKTELHPSTVSRAMKGKYLQYKKTVFIRDLFSAALGDTVDKEGLSAEGMKNMIREMIKGEDKDRPVSDQAISDQLKKQGIQISRRTVAKYRIQMGIPDSRQRVYL